MRDFFYNKGDILIAILIILVAAFIIYVRVGIIMDYSESGESGGSLLPKPPSVDEIIDYVTGSDAAGEAVQEGEGAAEPPADTNDTPQQENQPPAPPEENPQPEQPPEETPPAQQAGSVQIVVNAGDAASVIADKLLAAGAISDKQAFLSDVMAQKADSRLKMGTFTIPAGASHADIIAILTG